MVNESRQVALTVASFIVDIQEIYMFGCIHLMEKVHVNLCLSLPGIIIYK